MAGTSTVLPPCRSGCRTWRSRRLICQTLSSACGKAATPRGQTPRTLKLTSSGRARCVTTTSGDGYTPRVLYFVLLPYFVFFFFLLCLKSLEDILLRCGSLLCPNTTTTTTTTTTTRGLAREHYYATAQCMLTTLCLCAIPRHVYICHLPKGCLLATPKWGYTYWGEQADHGVHDMFTYCEHSLACPKTNPGCDVYAVGCASTATGPVHQCTLQPTPPPDPLNNTLANIFWRSAAKRSQAFGWFDRIFDYTCDEPGENRDRITACQERGNSLHAAVPGMRSLITAEKTAPGVQRFIC